jgi:hypothetical protein
MVSAHDPLRAALDVREQLATAKRRLAFFFGAGTSMAVGLPGIQALTDNVDEKLQGEQRTQYRKVRAELPAGSNVEDVLDRIRIYRELIGKDEAKEYVGIKGPKAAELLDASVCRAICVAVSKGTVKELKPHLILAQWLRALHTNREKPVEIFTANYDLLFEQAMEIAGVPFFDGFVGSVAPFFVPESVEADENKIGASAYPPKDWTRLWKIHGSVNWYMHRTASGDVERISRLSGTEAREGQELVVFPSREKYAESRKLPFIAYQDRLRKILSSGECLVIVIGYAFSDEHINEILFQGLRSNPRLAVAAFVHSDLSEKLNRYGEMHRNLTLYGPDKACAGGKLANWSEPNRKRQETESWPFWDEEAKRFKLGNFKSFASFLELFVGFNSPRITDVGIKADEPAQSES